MVRYDLAMHSLYAGRNYGCTGPNYEDIKWYEGAVKPTAEVLEAEWAKIEAETNAKFVAQNRFLAYPSTDELIVALWEKLVETDGLTSPAIVALQERRLQVKADFPK